METVSALLEADASEDHEVYGRLMGFPETTISAFGKDDALLPDDEYSKSAQDSLFQFKLSKHGSSEEVKQMKYWTDLVKKYASEVYGMLAGE